MKERRGTSTSNFGVGARESHDSSAFYERFHAPDLSDDTTILPPEPVDEPFVCGDARQMHKVADGSVALVVTSPPYFAGKQYEEELERDGIPATYLEYLEMLRQVFAECVRVLEPGGRIAVNVANLGRKPYRSLSADVIGILEELGLLLRGEIIWQKAEGASGNCAWGSFRGATNPVLRDLTERVVVASKGRFDRGRDPKRRAAAGLPHRSTITADDFMALTLDVWSIPAESARRVGHPAPFPVELPEQLIRLLTFEDDLVLDPFMGSGSTLVAASRLRRRYVGYDLDPAYVDIARDRVAAEGAPVTTAGDGSGPLEHGGVSAAKIAETALVGAGFGDVRKNVRIAGSGTRVSFTAQDSGGRRWCFDVAGPFTSHRGGLARTEVVWRTLGRASALRPHLDGDPLVVLTTSLPRKATEADTVLHAAGPQALFDVVDLLDGDSLDRLATYARGDHTAPGTGFWTAAELG